MKNSYILAVALLLGACNSSQLKPIAAANGFSTDGKKVTVYTTADSSNFRITPTGTISFIRLAQPVETQICIFVDPTKTYQTILGIGAALTDASAETFAGLTKEKQQEFLAAYYDTARGIGYTMARTSIGSTDFSSGSYTYVTENDSSLKTFSVDHDKKYRIPFIQQSIAAAGGKLPLFISPWSPPAWMKDNNDLLHGGRLKKEYYQPYANYFIKFINAYEKEGIPIWGTSIQNEPMATQRWESCEYTADEEKDFLKNNLGPTMAKEGYSDKKIIVWDHNRDLMYQRASTIFSDPEAARYAWGIGFHWYESWSGGDEMYNNVARVHESWPDKNILFTEGCAEKFDAAQLHNWKMGERYGRSMINDFNNGTVGWLDWNILLDDKGGPNHVGNYCFAPVHADSKTGSLVYTNAYYYIGQFSKFVRPGAKRVASVASRSQLLTTAFLNTNGKLAVVVMNTSDQSLPVKMIIKNASATTTILPHSIITMVL